MARQASGTSEALHRLAVAASERRPCDPPRYLLPPGSLDAAYEVQTAWVSGRIAAGAKVVGRKIGLTNPVVQRQLGVDRPDFGVLLDDMACPEGRPVDMTRTLQPRIEAEIAFVLARDLTGTVIGPAEVTAATAYVTAALEIVDSRIANWDISIVDTVADNASSALFVLGSTQRKLDDLGDPGLPGCTMIMWRGGTEVSRGSGAACLGNPLNAVAWLAATVRDHGRPLRAGEIVLSGALGPMVPVTAGDSFRAVVSGIGEVGVAFEEGTE